MPACLHHFLAHLPAGHRLYVSPPNPRTTHKPPCSFPRRAENVATVLSPPFLRFLSTNVSQRKAYLHASAHRCELALIAALTGDDTALALAVSMALQRGGGAIWDRVRTGAKAAGAAAPDGRGKAVTGMQVKRGGKARVWRLVVGFGPSFGLDDKILLGNRRLTFLVRGVSTAGTRYRACADNPACLTGWALAPGVLGERTSPHLPVAWLHPLPPIVPQSLDSDQLTELVERQVSAIATACSALTLEEGQEEEGPPAEAPAAATAAVESLWAAVKHEGAGPEARQNVFRLLAALALLEAAGPGQETPAPKTKRGSKVGWQVEEQAGAGQHADDRKWGGGRATPRDAALAQTWAEAVWLLTAPFPPLPRPGQGCGGVCRGGPNAAHPEGRRRRGQHPAAPGRRPPHRAGRLPVEAPRRARGHGARAPG